MEIIELHVPEYTVDVEPDAAAIGRRVDDVIRAHFMGKSVVVRGVASSEHPGKSQAELIDVIRETGTDRYDPERVGDRYDNVDGKQIDLFGVPAVVSATSEIFSTIVWGFYHSAIAIHGRPMRIDIAIIYDAEQLEQVPHRYEGRDDIKDDGFTFKNPANKTEALLGIISL